MTWLILAFGLGCAVGSFLPWVISVLQFYRMASEIESSVEQMSKIVPRRRSEDQPPPSWRVVK